MDLLAQARHHGFGRPGEVRVEARVATRREQMEVEELLPADPKGVDVVRDGPLVHPYDEWVARPRLITHGQEQDTPPRAPVCRRPLDHPPLAERHIEHRTGEAADPMHVVELWIRRPQLLWLGRRLGRKHDTLAA